MALFTIHWEPDQDRSDPHWTGFPTWSTVSEDTEAHTTLIDVPDNTLPEQAVSSDELAAHWQARYPTHAHKFVTTLPSG